MENIQLNSEKIKHEWEYYAKEEIQVEYLHGVWYGFTSEIGALRLFYIYNRAVRNDKTTMGYSEGYKSWYFCLEPNFTD